MKLKYKKKVSRKSLSESFSITGTFDEVQNFINTNQLPNILSIDYDPDSRR